ncbi:hypothetical protein UY3_11691 [Chelonia mydas]|uniref:Uncharacterized protein n=1 Tax=Chelonia mydas TaxID=8469 RepID=M7B017_CHEMY|nr:hypothetical protein UY3_11691 [Chelonia mydas]
MLVGERLLLTQCWCGQRKTCVTRGQGGRGVSFSQPLSKVSKVYQELNVFLGILNFIVRNAVKNILQKHLASRVKPWVLLVNRSVLWSNGDGFEEEDQENSGLNGEPVQSKSHSCVIRSLYCPEQEKLLYCTSVTAVQTITHRVEKNLLLVSSVAVNRRNGEIQWWRGFGRVINAGVFEPEFRGYIPNCAFDSHQPNTLDQAHGDLGHTIARDTIN